MLCDKIISFDDDIKLFCDNSIGFDVNMICFGDGKFCEE